MSTNCAGCRTRVGYRPEEPLRVAAIILGLEEHGHPVYVDLLSHDQADELIEKTWKSLDLTQAATTA